MADPDRYSSNRNNKFSPSFFLSFLAFSALPLYYGAVPVWYLSAAGVIAAISLCLPLRGGSAALQAYLTEDRAVRLMVGCLLLSFVLSTVRSRVPYLSIIEASKVLSVGFIVSAVLSTVADKEDLRRLYRVVVWLAVFLSVFGILQAFFLRSIVPGDSFGASPMVTAFFYNRNHFAGFLEIGFFAATALFLAETGKAAKGRLLAGLVTISTALILTASRGGQIATACGLVAGYAVLRCLHPKKVSGAKLLLIGGILIAAIAAILVFFGRFAMLDRILNRSLWNASIQYRLRHWEAAWNIFRSSPWIGSGPGTVRSMSIRYLGSPLDPAHSAHAHTEYLTLLAEMGIVGALFAAGTVLAIGSWFLRRCGKIGMSAFRDGDRAAALSMIAALLTAYAVHALVDYNLHIPCNLIYFLTVILAALKIWGEPTERSGGRSSFCLVFCLGLLMAFTASIGLSEYALWRYQNDGSSRPSSETTLNRAAFFFPMQPEVFFYQGLGAAARSGSLEGSYRRESRATAISYFERAEALDPYDPKYRLWRIRAQSTAFTPQELIAEYDRLMALSPKSSAYFFQAGRDLLVRNRRLKSEAVEKRAVFFLAQSLRYGPTLPAVVFEMIRKEGMNDTSLLTIKNFLSREYEQSLENYCAKHRIVLEK